MKYSELGLLCPDQHPLTEWVRFVPFNGKCEWIRFDCKECYEYHEWLITHEGTGNLKVCSIDAAQKAFNEKRGGGKLKHQEINNGNHARGSK